MLLLQHKMWSTNLIRIAFASVNIISCLGLNYLDEELTTSTLSNLIDSNVNITTTENLKQSNTTSSLNNATTENVIQSTLYNVTTTENVMHSNAISTLYNVATTENVIQSTLYNVTTTENIMQSNTISTLNKSIEYSLQNFPSNCSQREKLKAQPVYSPNSRIKKCCPVGENFVNIENRSEPLCVDSIAQQFKPSIITAILYDNCIEDVETEPAIDIEIGNPCNTSILYNDEDDMFYVLQDGSLLVMDVFANDSYTLERAYCLDMDISSGRTYAVVCITSVEEYLKRGQIITVAIFTLISIPCLLLIAYLHLAIKELRTVHGISLSMLSLSLAIGYFIHSLVHIFNVDSTNAGYAVQFFVLSYYFWYLCLCANVFLNIRFVITLNRTVTKWNKCGTLAAYCLICFVGPLIFVLLSVRKGLPGMPSFFIQGITESIRDSQRYFIPPVSTVLFLSFILMIASFFGFQKVKVRIALAEEKNLNIPFDETRHEEVKKDAKCISLLGGIMIIAWLLEIVTFYTPGFESYLILLEILNGLQGLFIMLIFLIVRRRRALILRWWYDRGTHIIESGNGTELTPINK